jgi:hypothetical protein
VAPDGGGHCRLCSSDETAQPRQCATLRDATYHRGGVQAVGGGGLWLQAEDGARRRRRQWSRRRSTSGRGCGAHDEHLKAFYRRALACFVAKGPGESCRGTTAASAGARAGRSQASEGTAMRPGGRVRAQHVAEGDVTLVWRTDRWSRARLGVRTTAYGAARRSGTWERGGAVRRRVPTLFHSDCHYLIANNFENSN